MVDKDYTIVTYLSLKAISSDFMVNFMLILFTAESGSIS